MFCTASKTSELWWMEQPSSTSTLRRPGYGFMCGNCAQKRTHVLTTTGARTKQGSGEKLHHNSPQRCKEALSCEGASDDARIEEAFRQVDGRNDRETLASVEEHVVRARPPATLRVPEAAISVIVMRLAGITAKGLRRSEHFWVGILSAPRL